MPTEFQKKVYSLLKKVPKGKVVSYNALAKKLNTSPRAIGQALRLNPFGAWGRVGGKSCRRQRCLIPCHRVVCSDGSLGGYQGKLNSKKKIELLRKEGITIKKGKIKDCLDFEVLNSF